jgi:hypothetical protein
MGHVKKKKMHAARKLLSKKDIPPPSFLPLKKRDVNK